MIADTDLWAYQLLCDNCQQSIFLPHQSPLGTFRNQEYLPTDAWPADFLCQQCERVFSYLPTKPHRGTPPLIRQLKNQSAIQVIRQLEEALAQMPGGTAAQAVAKEVAYFHEHQARMDYRAGRRAGEPIGSGPVEATCRQTQCRFKRPGQFWSKRGDEALLCLEMFWRNDRWHLLFPHTSFNPARN